MEDRIVTGICGMDQMVGGGFLPGSCIVLTGPPGSGKSAYCRELLVNQAKKGKKCMAVITNIQPEHLHELLEKKNGNQVTVLDAYSWREGKTTSDALTSLTDLNEFKSKFTAALGENEVIVIDSLTDLLMHNEPESVYKLFQRIAGAVKHKKLFLIACLEKGIHDPSVENTFNYITEGTIEMRLQENKRTMRVTRMNGTPHPLQWVEFVMDKGTFELKVKEFLR